MFEGCLMFAACVKLCACLAFLIAMQSRVECYKRSYLRRVRPLEWRPNPRGMARTVMACDVSLLVLDVGIIVTTALVVLAFALGLLDVVLAGLPVGRMVAFVRVVLRASLCIAAECLGALASLLREVASVV